MSLDAEERLLGVNTIPEIKVKLVDGKANGLNLRKVKV
jgi:hypothetical protein